LQPVSVPSVKPPTTTARNVGPARFFIPLRRNDVRVAEPARELPSLDDPLGDRSVRPTRGAAMRMVCRRSGGSSAARRVPDVGASRRR
jgi:hypothetical protein